MVRGITNFKKRFQGYEEQYVIIGGTACDLIMENEELPFRATKDIDLVLIVEALTAEFGETFWEFIKEAEYDHCIKVQVKHNSIVLLIRKAKNIPI